MGKPQAFAALAGMDIGLIQSQSIGYDGVASVLPEGCTFANAASVHEPSTAELAIGMMIASQRGFPDFVRNQALGLWDNSQRPSLADRRVLLVGYGGVGKAIEARLLPFETEITRMASRAREDQAGTICGTDALYEQLPLHEAATLDLRDPETTWRRGASKPQTGTGNCVEPQPGLLTVRCRWIVNGPARVLGWPQKLWAPSRPDTRVTAKGKLGCGTTRRFQTQGAAVQVPQKVR